MRASAATWVRGRREHLDQGPPFRGVNAGASRRALDGPPPPARQRRAVRPVWRWRARPTLHRSGLPPLRGHAGVASTSIRGEVATREGLTRRPGRQPREARPPGRPTPTRVARGRSALSPPPAAGPAQPSAAQPGATRACLGPNLGQSAPEPTAAPAAAWRRPPRCCGQRPYRPLLVARQRHSRAHPFALLARARAPRSLGGGDDDMADTDQPRRSSTSWSRETQTNGGKSAARPATYVLSTNTHSKDAPEYGAVAHRVRAHHAPQAARCAAVQHGHEARAPRGGRRRGATEAPIPLATPKMPQL